MNGIFKKKKQILRWLKQKKKKSIKTKSQEQKQTTLNPRNKKVNNVSLHTNGH